MTIWKYPVRIGESSLSMPDGARLVSAGMQDGRLHVWAYVDRARPLVETPVWVCGTGHPAPPPGEMAFVGTAFDGPFVWHVFGPVVAGSA